MKFNTSIDEIIQYQYRWNSIPILTKFNTSIDKIQYQYWRNSVLVLMMFNTSIDDIQYSIPKSMIFDVNTGSINKCIYFANN